MKKILSFILLGMVLCLTACGNRIDKVKLLSFSQEKVETKEVNKRQNVFQNELDYQFVVLQEEQYQFNLTIVLDNEKDYHIFDFTLSCDDEEIMILIDNEYVMLKNMKSINWRGDTNSKYTISMSTNNEEYLTTLKLIGIYYSDRENANNVYDVDLNGKETVEVYRVDLGFTAIYECIEKKSFKYKLTLNNEKIDKNTVYLGDTKIEFNEYNVAYIYLKNDNEIYSIAFKYILKDDLYYNSTFNIKVKVSEYLLLGYYESIEWTSRIAIALWDTSYNKLEFYYNGKLYDVGEKYVTQNFQDYYNGVNFLIYPVFEKDTHINYSNMYAKFTYEDYSLTMNISYGTFEIGD